MGTLSKKVMDKLPAQIDPAQIQAHLTLKVGLDSSWGETVLLLHDGLLLALSRDSVLDPFAVHTLDSNTPPRFDTGGWQETLYLKTIDGLEHGLKFSELDKAQALAGLSALYTGLEAWSALAAVLVFEKSLTVTTERHLDIEARLGEVYDAHLEDTDAAALCYIDVLDRRPDHADALSGLQRIADATLCDHPAWRARLQALIEAYAAQGLWRKVVDIRLQLLEQQQEGKERHEALLILANIYETHLAMPNEALAMTSEAWLILPDELELLTHIQELAALTGQWEEVAATIDKALERTTSKTTQETLLEASGRIYGNELARYDEAIDAYRKLLGLVPGHAQAIVALETWLTAQERWQELVDLLQNKLATTAAPDAKVQLYLRIAQLSEDKLDNTNHAIQANQQALTFDTHNPTAYSNLQRLYTSSAHWPGLFDLLQRMALATEDPTERGELRRQAAELATTQLEHPKQAIDLLRTSLKEDGEHYSSLSMLRDLFLAAKRWSDLADILERTIAVADTHEDTVDNLRTLGALYQDRLSNTASAEIVWKRLLEIDESDLETLSALRHIYQTERRFEPLVDILDRQSHAAEPGAPLRLSAQTERATILERELKRVDAAIHAWDAVLADHPTHAPALEALIRLHRIDGNLFQVATCTERKLELLEDPKGRVRLLLELGTLFEDELHDLEQAERHFTALLKLDPEHTKALQRLEHIHQTERDWASLIELYLNRASHTPDERDTLTFTLKAAKIAETRRYEPERAYQLLMKLFDAHWKSSAFNIELARLAAATDQWSDLLDLYVRLYEDTQDPTVRREIETLVDETITLFERRVKHWSAPANAMILGELFEHKLNSTKRALRYYRKAATSEPEALEGVRRILRRKERWRDLADHLTMMADSTKATNKDALRSLYSEQVEIYTVYIPTPDLAEAAQDKLEALGGSSKPMIVAAAVLFMLVLVVMAIVLR